MRRILQGGERAQVGIYERMIQLYVPYVLVRCARYTNRRRQAQQIGVYSLITTCLVADRLAHVVRVGRVVDLVTDVIGPDVVSGGEGEVWWAGSAELLLVDGRMRRTAQALNMLKGPLREVLVLHYLGGLEPDDLAGLLQRPAGEIKAMLARARRLLARRLAGPGDEGRGAGDVDVRSRLAEFTAGLDGGWMEEVAQCALEYLGGYAAGYEG
jgi:DNA-directed RNA polymerase specialized sigma24 family protein